LYFCKILKKKILNSLEQDFQSVLAGKKPENLYNPIGYILMQSGKRLRPQLVTMSVEMFGGDMQNAQFLAEAFEMLHNFTLIHDDIMDDAPIRRGKETVYKKWNGNIAILSGDALANMAFQQLLKMPCPAEKLIQIAKLFSQTSIEVCEGQQFDLDFETQETVTIEEYINMIRLKTAVMFAGCLKAGAMFADADEQSQQAIYDFGVHLGIAFQLADDVLDVYAETPAFGKTIGGDIRDNKKTYLYLKALELANPAQKATLQQLFATPTTDLDEKYKVVRQIFDDVDIKKQTEDTIQNYSELSLQDLQRVNVPDSKKEAFKAIVLKLNNRQK